VCAPGPGGVMGVQTEPYEKRRVTTPGGDGSSGVC